MSAEVTYQWLEPKPYKRTKQLGIRGRNMTVWNVVAEIVSEQATASEMAERFRLPIEAVREAMSYYLENRTWIDAENAEVGRQLGLV